MPKTNIQHTSVMALASLWKWYVKTIFKVDKSLTAKEFGQLKMLRRDLRDATPDVIERTLHNWLLFSSEARANAGLPCSPATPHIGFLLAHCDTAANLMYSLAKSSTSQSAVDTSFIQKMDALIEQQKKEIAAWKASD